MKNLKLLTWKNVADQLDVSACTAQTIMAEMRKHYKRKRITQIHLHDWLGVNELEVASEIMYPQNNRQYSA